VAIPPEYLFFRVFEPKPAVFGGGYEPVMAVFHPPGGRIRRGYTDTLSTASAVRYTRRPIPPMFVGHALKIECVVY